MNILNKIKKNLSGILVGATILCGVLVVSSVASATVFPSQQVGTSPVNGYYLQTNGVSSTWAAVSGGGGSANASGTIDQGAIFNGSSTLTSNNILYVPANFATAGCNGSSTLTDFGACVNSLYASASSTHGVTIWATADVSQANWTTPINFNINSVIPSLDCSSGVRLSYGGTGTAVHFNFNVSGAHDVSEDYGCTYLGASSVLSAGSTNAATTTGILFGGNVGSNSANGINFHDNTINGFGTDVDMATDTYMVAFNNNAVSGGGSSANQPYPGSLLTINKASNSGERMVFTGNSFTDPANSTSNNAVYIGDNAVADAFFTNNSFDDASVYVGIANGTVDLNMNHFENSAYSTYLMKYFIIASSSGATTLNVNDNLFALDNTGSTGKLSEGIEHAVNLTFDGNSVQNYGGASAITNWIDHTLNAGQAQESVANDWSQNNAVSNWVQLMGTPYPLNCFENANGYPFCTGATANGGSFQVGGTTIGTVGFGGTWVFGTTGGGSVSAANIEGTLYAAQYAGADIGAKVNAAYAAAVAAGNGSSTDIVIPAGNYSYSTPIVCGTNGFRCLIQGAAGGGTTLTYTGTGAAITLNYGIQSTGVFHAEGEGVDGLYLIGNNTATSSPQIGILAGGTNGAAGTVIDSVNIAGFGIGLDTASNTYNFTFQNSLLRGNGQNVYIAAASNSGEGLRYLNDFIVDGANNNPADCFYVSNSGTESLTLSGTELDDCQLHDLQANNITMTGGNFENPGYTAWGAYDYIILDQNTATNLDINGTTFFNDSPTSTAPTTFILNGGTVTLNGVIAREFGGNTVTSFVTTQGSGRTTWTGFNNVSNHAVNYVLDTNPFAANGSNVTSSYLGNFTVANFTASATSTFNGNVGIGGNENVSGTLAVASSATIGSATTTFQIFSNGHINSTGTVAQVSSCGTNPSINGTDEVGTVTVGSVSATSCTITFQNAWFSTSTMHVFISPRTAGIVNLGYSVTTGTIVITGTALANDVLDYQVLSSQ